MKNYVVVLQCDKVASHTCAGFQCEWAFNARLDAFAVYPKDAPVRYLPISCGGCPGQATLRKLINLKHGLKKRENAGIDQVMVHLSSCITRNNHHSPRCPHIDYLKTQITEAGFDLVEDSRISPQRKNAARQGNIYFE